MWILVTALLIFAVAVAIFWPYLRPKNAGTESVAIDPRLAGLYSDRDMLYQSVRDAQFDRETGKLSDEDYEQQSTRMKRRAAAVLRKIDVLESELVSPELDAQVEQEITLAREMPTELKTSANNGRSKGDRFCGQCGTTLKGRDRFCAQCGASVRV
ncbi:MAG: hypothetical protein GY759_21885 [Chloroflexi bacterium]|nr:hypothetical protein [Chloroflexota bacterium]